MFDMHIRWVEQFIYLTYTGCGRVYQNQNTFIYSHVKFCLFTVLSTLLWRYTGKNYFCISTYRLIFLVYWFPLIRIVSPLSLTQWGWLWSHAQPLALSHPSLPLSFLLAILWLERSLSKGRTLSWLYEGQSIPDLIRPRHICFTTTPKSR